MHCLGKLKILTFCRYSAIIPDMDENANKLHFKRADFNSCTRVTAYAECIYVFLLKSCTRHWIPCWLLTKHCSDVCCDKFPMPHVDRKSKQVKEQWHGKFYLQSVRRKTRYIKHQKYQNLWINNNSRGDKMQLVCIFFHVWWIFAENLKFNFPR